VEVDEVPTVAEASAATVVAAEASVATAVGSVVTVVAEEVDSVVTVVAEEVDSVVTAVAEVGFAETVVEVGSVVGVADLKLPKSSGKSCLHHQWHVG
jgi:hypothetical protein